MALNRCFFSDNLSCSLLKICSARGISQESLAELSNLSTKTINNIICKRCMPSLKTLEKICHALQITPNELLLSDNLPSWNPENNI